MTERNSRSRYAKMTEVLGQQSRVAVVGEVSERGVNGREGKTYDRTTIFTAPADASDSLNRVSKSLFTGVERIYNRSEVKQIGKKSEVVSQTFQTFDRTGDHSFHVTAVKVYPTQEQALAVYERVKPQTETE